MKKLSRYAVSSLRLLFLFVAVVVFSYSFSSMQLPSNEAVEAAASDTLSGYGWSDNIGWISFNCVSDGSCASSNYGVTVDTASGNLSGYAWSEAIGWLSFQPADLAGCPTVPCNPNVNRTSGAITGWVRALAGIGSPIADRRLLSWGLNETGQLGLNDLINRSSPTQVGTATNWSSIGVGIEHTIAIKTDGTLWAWGGNTQGQLGLGDTTYRISPVQIGTGTSWAKVAVGGYHTIAIKTDGTLWVWGYNPFGQLGLGDTTQRNSPTQVGTATNWSSVSGGPHHTIATKTDGTLWAWGYNNYGNLGLGDTTHRLSPVQVGTGTNWSSVTGGYGGYHNTVGIKSDGTLWAWGWNIYGQLGLGDTTNRLSPVQVGTGTNWASVTGGYHTAGIKSDGTLWAWGHNVSGELGLGDTTQRNSPTQVGAATNWESVTAGVYYTVAKKTDGTLWAWGSNSFGQLGLGDTTNRLSPVQVGTGTNWISAKAEADHTVAIVDLGSLQSGGWDGWVQLSGSWADGTRVNTVTPTSMMGYAWGSDVIGWVDMSRVTSSVSLICNASAGQSCSTTQNTCGLRNWGTIQCDGLCSAQFVPPESSCSALNTGTCITLTSNPKFVGAGGNTTLAWGGSCQGSACTLYRSDTGAFIASSTSGSLLQSSIASRRTYIFTCGSQSVSLTVGASLDFREF